MAYDAIHAPMGRSWAGVRTTGIDLLQT